MYELIKGCLQGQEPKAKRCPRCGAMLGGFLVTDISYLQEVYYRCSKCEWWEQAQEYHQQRNGEE